MTSPISQTHVLLINVLIALGRHYFIMAPKLNSLANLLVSFNLVSSSAEAQTKMAKHVRWCKTNMPDLALVHVANESYLVDEELFRKEFLVFTERRRQLQIQKSNTAKALNAMIRAEKDEGKRDYKGRLVAPKPTPSPNASFTTEAFMALQDPTNLTGAKEQIALFNELKTNKARNINSRAAKARFATLNELVRTFTAYTPS